MNVSESPRISIGGDGDYLGLGIAPQIPVMSQTGSAFGFTVHNSSHAEGCIMSPFPVCYQNGARENSVVPYCEATSASPESRIFDFNLSRAVDSCGMGCYPGNPSTVSPTGMAFGFEVNHSAPSESIIMPRLYGHSQPSRMIHLNGWYPVMPDNGFTDRAAGNSTSGLSVNWQARDDAEGSGVVHAERIRSTCKRRRTSFSVAQKAALEAAFEKKQFMNYPERKEFCRMLGITETQVLVWFKNRRAKFKKNNPGPERV